MKGNRNVKTAVIVMLVPVLMACFFIMILVFLQENPQKDSINRFEQAAPSSGETPDKASVQTSRDSQSSEVPQDGPESYQSPVDFQSLQAVNPDIYAWLDIPGTDISYPLLQRGDDDTFYLTHDAEGKKNKIGALFTEATCNNIAFDDPVTVIYGHHMKNDLMFGRLQEYYSDSESFEEYNEIIVFLPDREMHFEVFAAVPYDNRHLLLNYDFTDKRTFRLFFDDILSIRSIGACFADGATVQSDEQVLILSTCLKGDQTRRYLVCAKLLEDES